MSQDPRQAGPDSCVIVIFGASGDLTHRKLIPALFELEARGDLPKGTCVLGVSRTEMSDETFRDRLRPSAEEFAHSFDAGAWERFASRVHYCAGDATDPTFVGGLGEKARALGRQHGVLRPSGSPNVLFYLSVAPTLYEPIIDSIGAAGLVVEGKRWCSLHPEDTAWQRIIVEKPFGSDLASAQSLNRSLGRVFEEDSVFRIDHYLGKELVQNILVMRFANTIFEPVWNRTHVDHVQVTAAETVGVGSRAANFYDRAGALRDMVQSHLLQILALVAMEPPTEYDASSIMREKIKLFGAALSPSASRLGAWGALGRYGASGSEPAYEDEPGVEASRRTETYAALKLEFDTWRWSGVPFYLRSGKRMARKLTEVVVQFRKPPTNLFRAVPGASDRPANRIVITIAPRDGIRLRMEGKVPGSGLTIDSADLELDYVDRFGGQPIEAYAPLILDAMGGDRTLFKHRDEVEGSWRIAEPFLTSERLRDGIETYAPGSWGPASAEALMAGDGRVWHNPDPGDQD